MRILIVAATDAEVQPFAAKLGEAREIHSKLNAYTHQENEIHILISGVGMVATAAWCSAALIRDRYELAINLGVCGTFDPNIKVTQVVNVFSDRISELGAEDGEMFLAGEELGLLDANEFPFVGGRLVNSSRVRGATLTALPKVDGITVNTVHGYEPSIAAVKEQFRPQVESMEGAAFMYACLIHQVPLAQVRAVSNVIEKRNRAAWDLAGAIRNLSEAAVRIIEEA